MDKIFTIIIVFSAVFFIYNKVKTWRSDESLIKRLYQTKAGLSLGFLLTAFAANLLVMPRGKVDIIIGIIFIIFGIANVVFNFRAYKHYANQFDEN
ncbi:YtpI family protein [Halalkalibacter urbisdiaboli]|uniref:YtpI family protein n=1 Tax=Halalkalibacter urbisdiaboli TaxID=1960589 RepID=UPI000B43C6D8|nr:YtpI family protein [Halalkalibacter urbisdiaboli]